MSKSEQIAELKRLIISTFAKQNGKTPDHYVIETGDADLTKDDSGDYHYHLTIQEVEGPLHDVHVTFEPDGDIHVDTRII